MARIVSIFQFTGRAGSAVGSKGKGGKILLRQYQPTVANPRTQAQMSHRAKIKLAAQVAGMLGEVGRTALIANGLRKTERGQLIKQLLQSVKVSADGSTPTSESTLYSEPFTLSDTATVKAIAIKDEQSSTVSSKTFTKGTTGGDDTE